MTEAAYSQTTRSGPNRALRLIWRFILGIIKRVYAVALIAIIVWLSWRAIAYLLESLLFISPPAQVVDVPRRLDTELLEQSQLAFTGVRATEHPRVPPGHYHRFGPWFQPDHFNDCTRSGCHAPLPHNRRKEDRAFLNMHATSIHCGVCHLKSESEPLPLTWYDLDTGEGCGPPAILRAYAWLHEQRVLSESEFTRDDQRQIVSLLRTASEEAGGEPALDDLAEHLAAVRHSSDDFRRLLDVARETVPKHFRGEYGTKLALRRGDSQRPLLGHPAVEDAMSRYLRQRDTLSESEKEALLAEVHPRRRPQTLTCTDCHRATGSLVDLSTVGYPPKRIESLVRPLVMRAIEHIMEGREFYMPGFMQPGRSLEPGMPEREGP